MQSPRPQRATRKRRTAVPVPPNVRFLLTPDDDRDLDFLDTLDVGDLDDAQRRAKIDALLNGF